MFLYRVPLHLLRVPLHLGVGTKPTKLKLSIHISKLSTNKSTQFYSCGLDSTSIKHSSICVCSTFFLNSLYGFLDSRKSFIS